MKTYKVTFRRYVHPSRGGNNYWAHDIIKVFDANSAEDLNTQIKKFIDYNSCEETKSVKDISIL